VQQKVRTEIQQCARSNGPLRPVVKAMNALSQYPWKAEAPTSRPTQKPQRRGTTPTPEDEPQPWIFAAKWKTPIEKFKTFVQELDEGAGSLEIDDISQVYRTSLTSAQAEGLQDKYPFLELAYANVVSPDDPELENEEFHAVPRAPIKTGARSESTSHLQDLQNNTEAYQPIAARKLLPADKDAPYWKKMIGSPFQPVFQSEPKDDPPYMHDDSEGKGTTIYVLDDGFDLEEYSVSLLKARTPWNSAIRAFPL